MDEVKKRSGPFFMRGLDSQEEVLEVVEDLLELAGPDSVYTDAQRHGEYVLITASEITASAGGAFGSGGSSAVVDETTAGAGEMDNAGGGGGGGAGGAIFARPVAIISVGPAGVEVQPVVDVTKLGIALFTALGAMFIAAGRMKRGS